MIPKSGYRFSESDHAQKILSRGRAAQLRIARRIDPVGALWRCGEKYASLAAEIAAQLGAREQRREPWFAAGGEQAQPIERARDHPVIDQLQPGVAERAADFEAQFLELAREVHAIPPILDRALDAHRAELCVDAVWRRARRRQAQFGNARRDVVLLDIAAKDLDGGCRAAILAEAEHILAPDPADMTPDRVARATLVFRNYQLERRQRPDHLDPLGIRGLGAAAARADDLQNDQSERADRPAIHHGPRQRRMQFAGKEAEQRQRNANAGGKPRLRLISTTQNRVHAVLPDDRFAEALPGRGCVPVSNGRGRRRFWAGRSTSGYGTNCRSARHMALIHRI